MLLPFEGLTHPLVIAHRGSEVLAPENTVYAFDLAVEAGADVLEMDVRPSADGAIMVIHDATVDRTSSGRGEVSGMTRKELSKLDFAWNFTLEGADGFPLRGQGIGIATLPEVLKRYPSHHFSVDVKENDPAFVAEVVKAVLKADSRERVVLASFHKRISHLLRDAVPTVHTAADQREGMELLAASLTGLPFCRRSLPSAYLLPLALGAIRIPTGPVIRKIHALGRRGYFWTVDDEATMRRLLASGADGIITNRTDLLYAVRESLASQETRQPGR